MITYQKLWGKILYVTNGSQIVFNWINQLNNEQTRVPVRSTLCLHVPGNQPSIIAIGRCRLTWRWGGLEEGRGRRSRHRHAIGRQGRTGHHDDRRWIGRARRDSGWRGQEEAMGWAASSLPAWMVGGGGASALLGSLPNRVRLLMADASEESWNTF
jgi:hypothetical protein